MLAVPESREQRDRRDDHPPGRAHIAEERGRKKNEIRDEIFRRAQHRSSLLRLPRAGNPAQPITPQHLPDLSSKRFLPPGDDRQPGSDERNARERDHERARGLPWEFKGAEAVLLASSAYDLKVARLFRPQGSASHNLAR